MTAAGLHRPFSVCDVKAFFTFAKHSNDSNKNGRFEARSAYKKRIGDVGNVIVFANKASVGDDHVAGNRTSRVDKHRIGNLDLRLSKGTSHLGEENLGNNQTNIQIEKERNPI